jgi:threonine dehydratase
MPSITKDNIEIAHQRIQPFIHRTPVLTNASINDIAETELYFKCENLQKIGAFKIRGGMNAALSLSAEKLSNGLATHSSGNHAQAIAYAAKALGVKAFIVMPSNSPAVKINAVKGYGAEITFCEPNQAARESTVQNIIAETGAAFIHPYDDDRVIIGQATCAKEFIEEVPGLNVIIAPVGGGGLLSGTSLAAHFMNPDMEVFAGEPEGAADAILSFQSGKVEKAPYVKTIADGLLTTLSEQTLSIIQKHVKNIFTVSDDEIKAALKLVYERMKIVVEPSAVVPLAVVLKNKALFKGKKTGIIFSGGNVDLARFGEWFQ